MSTSALQLISDLRQQLDRLEGLLQSQPADGRPLPSAYSSLDHQLIALLAEVASSYGVTEADIQGRRRTQPIADARLMFYFLAFQFLRAKRRQIAAFVGRRDHSAVSYGISEMKSRIVLDDAVGKKFKHLKSVLFP